MSLQKGFFMTEPFNPSPFWDNTIVNLSGAQKFEEDTVFPAGRYRIELAPGLDGATIYTYNDHHTGGWFPATGTTTWKTVVMSYDEVIDTNFIVRAYCGSTPTTETGSGVNLYAGEFKVNAVNADTITQSTTGVDVNHIFGAGGGNGYIHQSTSSVTVTTRIGGGANCLGDGATIYHSNNTYRGSGAGSCLHILPVGGVFGSDYIRAYHASPCNGYGGTGGAYGGGATPNVSGDFGTRWFTRGGNSPYGNGATTNGTAGSGVGAGQLRDASGAYFNGLLWNTVPASILTCSSWVLAPRSFIRITYLGALN